MSSRDARASLVEALFREHNPSLVAFLRARLPADADAHEAAQEAYLRLLKLDTGAEPEFLRAYLFRTAENVARDIKRRSITRLRAGERAVDLAEVDPGSPVEEGQEARLAAVQALEIADRVLGELPPRCRQAVLLRRRDGWDVGRVAEHLGVSPRMVNLYLERAVEHLQRALKPEAMGARK